MKPYFAKYFPVEGEIKEGDSFFENDNLVLNWDNLEDLPYINAKLYIKKAKLFLCSRDIQVGDKVRLENGEQVEIVTLTNHEKDTFGVKSDSIWGNYSKVFKVVGEVSLGAKWVKEGDEVDENQVGVLYNFVGEDADEELYSIEDFPKEVKKWYHGNIPTWFNWNIINIKCYCCDTYK